VAEIMVGAPVKPTGPPTPPLQKPRPETPRREPGSSKRGDRPALFIRIVISLLIAWHFTGIFLAALSIPERSPLVMALSQRPPMQNYLDMLYMNQGHSFFAPDVGPGHVLRYELFDRSNTLLNQGTLPDKKEHWPRLLYHRHMMLADQSDIGDSSDPAGSRLKQAYLEGYGRHLLRLNRGAQTVRVQLYAHWPLPSSFLQDGRAAGYQRFAAEMSRGGQPRRIDQQGYELVGEAVQRRSDLPPEPDPEPEPPAEPSKQSFMQRPAPGSDLNWQRERPYVAGRRSGVPIR
jgi:hypothetical protein